MYHNNHPVPNQFEVKYVGEGLSKVSVYEGHTGRLLYSVTTSSADADYLSQQMAARGYLNRENLLDDGMDDWSFCDDCPSIFDEVG